MPDMLVKLYDLPACAPSLERQQAHGIIVRRALVPERNALERWMRSHFPSWVSEASVSFSRQPVSCFIAIQDNQLIGFACYDATLRGFFGPTGVSEVARGKGTGTALFLMCLHDMWAQGYGYAIIGAAGPTEFYEKCVGATPIPGSSPGIYAGMLPLDQREDA